MAFKLRRPPLLVYDNGPIYSRCYSSEVTSYSNVNSRHDGWQTQAGRRQMSAGLVGQDIGGQDVRGLPSTFSATTSMMDQGVASTTTATASNKNSTGGGHLGPTLHVNFGPPDVVPAVVERKKKFLTAKYGTHQMSLIKKRLGVEMWMYDEIQYLFGVGDNSTGDCEMELDLDELLDIDDENGRKNWLKEKLINAKQSQEAVKKFIDELISRAKTL